MFEFIEKYFSEKVPEPPSIEQLKRITKVLIIDDEEPKELRELLKKEGWKISYIDDLDSLSNKKLEESHIVCIDIMGVGKKLQIPNGMGLVKDIKEKYPEKKIILYSSVSKQDIFSDALDYVDKRLRKESSLVPFSAAIEELAKSTFSWDESIKYAYAKVKDLLGEKIEFEQFKAAAEKSITKEGWSKERFMKKLRVGLEVASIIAPLVELATKS